MLSVGSYSKWNSTGADVKLNICPGLYEDPVNGSKSKYAYNNKLSLIQLQKKLKQGITKHMLILVLEKEWGWFQDNIAYLRHLHLQLKEYLRNSNNSDTLVYFSKLWVSLDIAHKIISNE